VDELGFDSVDVGSILQSWKQQPGSPIYCRDLTREELKKRADAMGTNWSAMRDTIISKRNVDQALMKSDYAEYLRGLKG
jgi:hypothetical protein